MRAEIRKKSGIYRIRYLQKAIEEFFINSFQHFSLKNCTSEEKFLIMALLFF